MSQTVFVKDGEDLLVFAEIKGPSVTDPCGAYTHVAESYRVVAQLAGATLVLVPVGEGPVAVAEKDVKALKEREAKSPLEKSIDWIRKLIHNPSFTVDVRSKFNNDWRLTPVLKFFEQKPK